MASNTPWSIKGVDSKTRKIIKTQAHKAGVTIGVWLADTVNMAIMQEYAAEQKHAEQQAQMQENQQVEFEQDLQMTGTGGAQVTPNGAMNSRKYTNSSPHSQTKPPYADPPPNLNRQNFNQPNFIEFNLHQNVATMKNSRNRMRHNQNDGNYDNATGGFRSQADNQVTNGFGIIENALTDLVDHIELTDSHNSSALRDMQAQIAQLNQRSQSEVGAQEFHQEFSDMEGRLANLADRIDEMNENSAAFSEPYESQVFEEPKIWGNANQASTNQPAFEQSNLLSRFDELFVKLDNISHQQTDYGNSIKYLELGIQNQFDKISGHFNLSDTASTAAQTPEINQPEISEMEQKLAQLSQRLDKSLATPHVDPQIAELEEQIGNLSGKLSDLLAAPKPEYSPVPIQQNQTPQQSEEITELRDSIEQINQRLEKTEERLGGIDRLEDNMTRLIESVSDIRENSRNVAEDAATAAIEIFAKNQSEANQVSENLETNDNLDTLIAAKFSEISAQNDEAEKIQLSGFKTVQTSLEKIMDRLARVEDGRYAPSAPPPDHPHERSGQGAEQDFIQPGAETKAEQPQDITAEPINNIARTKPKQEAVVLTSPPAKVATSATPAKSIMAVDTSNAIQADSKSQNPNIAATQLNRALDQTASLGLKTADEQNETTGLNNLTPDNLAVAPSVTANKTLDTNVVSNNALENVAADHITPSNLVAADVELAAVTVEQRPTVAPSSSADFIAAARRAAQQAYENDKDSDAEPSARKSLFKRKKSKKSKVNEPEVLTTGESNIDLNVVDENTDLDTENTNKKKKFSVKSLLSKIGSKKKQDDHPMIEPLANDFTSDLPTDIFEEDFFKDVDMPAKSALASNAKALGNELSVEAQDGGKSKRKGAAPVVIALFCVTVLVTAVSWYALRPQTTMVEGNEAAMSETSSAADATQNPTNNETAEPTDTARTILNNAKVGLSTATNGVTQPAAKEVFTPEEFDKLAAENGQVHKPTAQQLEALRNKNNLITNSIPEANQKSYEKSLLGNHGKFSKNKDTSRVGSSSLSKSIKNEKPATKLPETAPKVSTKSTGTLPTVKYGAAPDDLPTSIGPKLLRQNAMIGQAAEQFEIANRYALGYGVDIDLVQSYKWFIKAAQNKLAVAQFSVGMMLEHGKGTDRNLSLSRNYYQRAAEQGNLMSIYRLAMMNAAPQNPTTKPDFKVALKWFNMAANAGLVDAQYNLAVLYEKGHGTDVDLVETYKWYTIAGNKGDQQATKRANTIKLELSASQIVKAQAAIKSWKVNTLPDSANVAPKLAYLKTETPNGNTQLTESKHVTVGTIAGDMTADKASIRDTQKMLTSLGWHIGGADGIMGPKTSKAISEFQTRHNLLVTGRVDDELLANLEAATL